MKFTTFLVSCGVLLGSGVAAKGHSINDIVKGDGYATAYACSSQLRMTAKFCEGLNIYPCWCTNEAAIASMAGCIKMYDRMNPETVRKLNKLCGQRGGYNTTLTFEKVLESYKYFLQNAKYTREIEDFSPQIITNVPIRLNTTIARSYRDSAFRYTKNHDDSLWYGAGLLGYWAAVLCLGSTISWSYVILPKLFKNSNGSWTNWFRRNFVMAPTFKSKNAVPYSFLNVNFASGLLPLRWESIVIVGFVSLTIAFSGAGIRGINNDPITREDIAVAHYIADRTGILVVYLVPLMLLFAGRNNFLQWLTQWHYDTFILFHRWIARVAFLLIVTHAGAYSYYFDVAYRSRMKQSYIVWGMVATVLVGFILLLGMFYLRRKAYEIFHLLHVVLAIVFIIAGWKHTDASGYAVFFYPCAAIWAFDWAVRLGRCVYFGFPKAKITVVADDLLRVEVPHSSWWKAPAGSHIFIYFLTPTGFFQSHPFSAMTFPDHPTTLVALVKVKCGLTKSIFNRVARKGNSMSMRITVEGPYGHGATVSMQDRVVYVASGVGFPGIYSELSHAASKSRYANRQLCFHWITNDYQYVHGLHDDLAKLSEFRNVTTTVYITKGASRYLSSEKYQDSKRTSDTSLESSQLSNFSIVESRPDIDLLVRNEIDETDKAVAFVSCCSPVINDQLRNSIRRNMQVNKRVDYFDQLQVWA